MNAAQHVKSEIRMEGIHGFLISARSLCCETRQEVYELLCTYVKHEDSSQVRWVVIRLQRRKPCILVDLFCEDFFSIILCIFVEFLVYSLLVEEYRVPVFGHGQVTN